ncbi:MAG: DUF3048 domain-containing protein [bacterium]
MEAAAPPVSPLSGLPLADGRSLRRPIAVIIDNTKFGRPETGLINADLVYEIRVEGGITRYMAFFLRGTPRIVGPVRSVREYFLPIVMEHDAMLVHAGGSATAWNDLVVYDIADIDAIKNRGVFFRSNDRKAPYNLYARLPENRRWAEKQGWDHEDWQPSRVFQFDDRVQPAGVEKTQVTLHFSNITGHEVVGWSYNPKSRKYVRLVNGVVMRDAVTGDLITADNIIVQKVILEAVPNSPKLYVDVQIIGSGDAMVLYGGKMRPLRWEKADVRSQTVFTEATVAPGTAGAPYGSPLVLHPGVTWVEVVPNNTPFE